MLEIKPDRCERMKAAASAIGKCRATRRQQAQGAVQVDDRARPRLVEDRPPTVSEP